MVNITLFEVHLDDSTLTANAPFSAESEAAGASEDEDETEAEEGGSGGPLAALVGFVLLVLVGVALRRFLRGDDGDREALGDPDSVADVDIET